MAITVTQEPFGVGEKGEKLTLYTISNANGMKASVTNIGADLVKLCVPDREGRIEDVVLGFDKGEEYYSNNGSVFGATVGPSANRIGQASFELDGSQYSLARNDNENNLHSDSKKGFQARVWDAEILTDGIRFTITDPDGNMGFPGNKMLQITYTLDENNGLKLHYHGTSDKNTILNPTNHSYFNLNGHKAGNIEDHMLWLNAGLFTPVAAGAIPTGEILPVKDTPMDFTEEKRIGEEIDADMEQLKLTGGYDHNYVIDGADGSLKHAATVRSEKSGREMRVYTTLPGIQFYAGNFISRQEGKEGFVYDKRYGLCLETQYFPDSIHHSNFPSYVFGPGREYDSETVIQFV